MDRSTNLVFAFSQKPKDNTRDSQSHRHDRVRNPFVRKPAEVPEGVFSEISVTNARFSMRTGLEWQVDPHPGREPSIMEWRADANVHEDDYLAYIRRDHDRGRSEGLDERRSSISKQVVITRVKSTVTQARAIVKAFTKDVTKFKVTKICDPEISDSGSSNSGTTILSRTFVFNYNTEVTISKDGVHCNCKKWAAFYTQRTQGSVSWCPCILAMFVKLGFQPGAGILFQCGITLREGYDLIRRSGDIQEEQDPSSDGWVVCKSNGNRACKCQAMFAKGRKCNAMIEREELRLRVRGQLFFDDSWKSITVNFHLNSACVNARLDSNRIKIPNRPSRFPLAPGVIVPPHVRAASGLRFMDTP